MRQDPPSLNVSNNVRMLTSDVVECDAIGDKGLSFPAKFSSVVDDTDSFLLMSLSSFALRST